QCTSTPRLHAMASMSTKSQLEVCGAPTRTVGRFGAGSVTSFHRLTVQKARAMRRRIMVSTAEHPCERTQRRPGARAENRKSAGREYSPAAHRCLPYHPSPTAEEDMSDSARAVILGGHGKIALLAAPKLKDAGDVVDSVIRNPQQSPDVE